MKYLLCFIDGVGTRQSTQKTVAIVLGGMVGVGLGVACLLVTRSAFKKKSKSKYGGGWG